VAPTLVALNERELQPQSLTMGGKWLGRVCHLRRGPLTGSPFESMMIRAAAALTRCDKDKRLGINGSTTVHIGKNKGIDRLSLPAAPLNRQWYQNIFHCWVNLWTNSDSKASMSGELWTDSVERSPIGYIIKFFCSPPSVLFP
jgi:hypothetical protein